MAVWGGKLNPSNLKEENYLEQIEDYPNALVTQISTSWPDSTNKKGRSILVEKDRTGEVLRHYQNQLQITGWRETVSEPGTKYARYFYENQAKCEASIFVNDNELNTILTLFVDC